jgi:hypothetical protein
MLRVDHTFGLRLANKHKALPAIKNPANCEIPGRWTLLTVLQSGEEVRMLTMLRMTVALMEYMCTEYDDMHSRIEVSETRMNKELRDKVEEQARQDTTMGDT